MERYINILVIEENPDHVKQLKSILSGGGNNLIFSANKEEFWEIISRQEIGIILISSQSKSINFTHLLQDLEKNPRAKEAYKIIVEGENSKTSNLVNGLREGAVDFIPKPFNRNLINAKIEVFKNLYFKDRRITQLLENIFPIDVLNNLNTKGKYSPRKIKEGVVLFTDFIAFTKAAKKLNRMTLIHDLEGYFTKFDEIIERYNLEKIKTIGDSYMAIAGVTENNQEPEIRATLAALEIRNYIINTKQLSEATNHYSWDIRIGIHSGPLIAGIIGTKKMSFDVWGDTVNIASRAEQNSEINSITITQSVAKKIKNVFNITHRGGVEIKHGGFVDMYFVEDLKREVSLFHEGRLPNSELRKRCDLLEMDFDYARKYIITKLKALLPEYVEYHDIDHTLNVEKSAIRLAKLEGISKDDLILLRTAVLFHDSGFIFKYDENEEFAKRYASSELPKFGYNKEQINEICEIIEVTKRKSQPKTLLQKIMCDADNDYLGRADYYVKSRKLRHELENRNIFMSEIEWIDFQLEYLENTHDYFTNTAINIREKGKMNRIKELKKQKILLEAKL